MVRLPDYLLFTGFLLVQGTPNWHKAHPTGYDFWDLPAMFR
jgi:hypothetical protein